MTQYILQAHRNKIDANIGILTPYHTGYDLITIYDDGSRTIESFDLARVPADIGLGESIIEYTSTGASTYIVDGKEIVWHDTLSDTNAKEYNNDVSAYLNAKSAATVCLATDDEAVNIFNKIKTDAIFRNSLAEVGLIDYDLVWPNCNCWASHMDRLFIQENRDGRRIFDDLGGILLFWGSEGDFTTNNEYWDNQKAQIIDNAVKKVFENNPNFDPSTLDLSALKWGLTAGDNPNLYLEFSDGENVYVVFNNTAVVIGSASRSLEDQICKLTDQFTLAEQTKSPLILDLNGDGIKTTSATNSGVFFNHDGNSFAETTGWVDANDGLLVRDLNGNGTIDTGSELFGSNTLLNNGTKAANGFEALRDLDSNGDGVFDVNDTAFNELLVWENSNLNLISYNY